MPKRTYQPKKRRRAKRHGFLGRQRRSRQVITRRRRKGRSRLTP